MNFQKYLVPAGAVVVMALAWHNFRWPGLALTAGAAVMWILLHFTRAMQVLKRAADRPVGFVASAVMLNAKLKRGMSLLHVVAMTKSLGSLCSEKDVQPELFRWTDAGQSSVDCEFREGKLAAWTLTRPTAAEEPGASPAGLADPAAPAP